MPTRPRQPTPPLTCDQSRRVAENLALVFHLLRKLRITEHQFDDCYEAGVMALTRAARGFDPARGFKFSTYAYRSILMGVLRARQKHVARAKQEHGGDVLDHSSPADPRRPYDAMEAAEQETRMANALRALDRKSRDVMWLRFWESKTLEEIGKAKGFTRERARQIVEKSLKTLREAV